MTKDLKAQIEIGVGTSGVDTGVAKTKDALNGLGAAAKAAGKEGSAGLDKIGDGAQSAAGKVDRATKSMISAIQRATAYKSSDGPGTASSFEQLAKLKGIDPKILQPYLDGLKQAEAAAGAAAGKVGDMGMSAKALNNAMRGVPAQFTDIVVSLQSGQKPLTVLMQQGGQLKDMFGGVGNALKAIGSYVFGLINPFTILLATVGGIAYAYYEGSKEMDGFNKAVIMSGSAAGVTSTQLAKMARDMSAVTGTRSQAAAALAAFAQSGSVSADSLQEYAASAVRFEKATGTALDETVKRFSDLRKAPLDATLKLDDAFNYLTLDIYKQIKALSDHGRTLEAATLAQDSLKNAQDDMSSKMESKLGYLERAWKSLGNVAKETWDKMLNVGRPSDPMESANAALDAAVAKLERLKKLGPGKDNTLAVAAQQQVVNNLAGAKLNADANQQLRIDAAEAAAQARRDKQNQQVWDGIKDRYLTKNERLQRELSQAREAAKNAPDDPGKQADLKRIEGEIALRNKDTDGIAKIKAQRDLDVENIRKSSEKLVGVYSDAEKIMEAVRSAGAVSDQDYYASKKAFLDLESNAKEQALRDEIRRLKEVKLTGQEKLENDKKIVDAEAKLAKVQTDRSTTATTLAIQEAAANAKLQASYLGLHQAQQNYYDDAQKAQRRQIAQFGLGTNASKLQSGLDQINDKYNNDRRALNDQKAQQEKAGTFNADAKESYNRQLIDIDAFQKEALASWVKHYDDILALQRDGALGAAKALQDYQDSANNTFDGMGTVMGNALKGMEDALVKFVTTGKLSFTELANSIVADITRVIIKQQISNALGVAGSGGAGDWLTKGIGMLIGGSTGTSGATDYSAFFSRIGGNGRASGGPVSAGTLYQVNEKGPELLNVAGKQYLMMGNQAGSVTPNSGIASGGTSVVVNNSFVVGNNTDARTQQQIATMAGDSIRRAMARNA